MKYVVRVPVVSVASKDDHVTLSRVLRLEISPITGVRWAVKRCPSPLSALDLLRTTAIPVIFCDCDLPDLDRNELLGAIAGLPAPPTVVMTSRLADDRLWAEVLNLGAFDLLAKPLDRAETLRTVKSAWLHWSSRSGSTERARESAEKTPFLTASRAAGL